MDRNKTRLAIQCAWTAATNSYAVGFVQGKIYQGKLKSVCLPGLNCYSCPGSLGSCPIGSLQAVLSSPTYHFSFYVFGFLILIGTVFGRLVCGFLCPFGLLQELLNKIPFRKKIKSFRGDRALRYMKYAVLAVFVILLPLIAVDAAGNGSPWFCKWICPAGTLEGGLPLVAMNPALREAIGFLFTWKAAILAAVLAASILIYRPFCKYICPLGAVYALFNRIAIYSVRVDKSKCNGCGACAESCPMLIRPAIQPNHGECVRCGACKGACPSGAISSGFRAAEPVRPAD